MNTPSGEQKPGRQPGESKPEIEVQLQTPKPVPARMRIDPKVEEKLRKAKWRQGFEPRGGHGKSGHGPNLPLRHHQVHGRGQ